jgi:hypothetical protein
MFLQPHSRGRSFNMSNAAALEVLERRLTEMERKANVLVETINDLRAEDGLPPRPPFGTGGGGGAGSGSGGATLSQIKPDTFYGKKLQTAVREYLEMRWTAAGNHTDPATPKEIHDAITKGGYQFDAKTPEIALVGLRALLRKRSAFFHKLPNGTYGLTAWYPDAKKPKAEAEEEEPLPAVKPAMTAESLPGARKKPETEAATAKNTAAAS